MAVFLARCVASGQRYSGELPLSVLRVWILVSHDTRVRGRNEGNRSRTGHWRCGRWGAANGNAAGSSSDGLRSAACGLVAEEGAEIVRARVAGLVRNQVTLWPESFAAEASFLAQIASHSTSVAKFADEIQRHFSFLVECRCRIEHVFFLGPGVTGT